MSDGGQGPWRWWEERNAPSADDLYTDDLGSGCLAMIVAMFLTVVVWGGVAAIIWLR
jgi:hypothetical protein